MGSSHKKWLGPYTVTKISEKGVATLKNNSGLILNKKYNVGNLKHFFHEESIDNGTSPTVSPSSNFWSFIPDEIVKIILLHALQQSRNSVEKCETYNSIKSTCRKWSEIVEKRGIALLPKVYVDTRQPIGKSYNGKILVSTRKLTSTFRKLSGLASQPNCIDDKKWKSSWLILKPEKYSWYTITRIFWKIKSNESSTSQRIPAIWIKNELYELKDSDREILEGSDCWLNDNLMDAGQKLICKALGSLEAYQSVLNCQKKQQKYFPVTGDHIQLLHNGNCHWLLTFNSSGRIQVCDSLRTNLTSVTKQCLRSLYKPLLNENGKLEVTFLPVEKQTDGFNCGLFALAYASIILDGKSPTDFQFLVNEMRAHYIKCLKEVTLHPFPVIEKTPPLNNKAKFFLI